ncbi:hypothetical protein VPHD148_0315 [Vibrio phage D148]
MINPKQVKDAAALVGALAGIVTGIEKIRSTTGKWVSEYKEKRNGQREEKALTVTESDEQ